MTQVGTSPVCAFSVSPTSASIGGAGGVGSATVLTTAGCAWAARSDVSWISVRSGTSGTASGAVSYNVQANQGKVTRTGTLTIAGQTVSITQTRRRH